MPLNLLHFNNGRTEVTIWTQWALWIWVPLSATLKASNLGVKTDWFPTWIRSLSKVKPPLLFRDFERVLLAFISDCIDYCYILSVGISQASLSHLQFIRNVAPRLLTGACKSTFLLHWCLRNGCLFILGFNSRFY